MRKVNVKSFLIEHEGQILLTTLLMLGTGLAVQHITHQRDGNQAFYDMIAVCYKDPKLMEHYVNKTISAWTPKNKLRLANRGADILKQIGEGLSY